MGVGNGIDCEGTSSDSMNSSDALKGVCARIKYLISLVHKEKDGKQIKHQL